jgi:mutator protein MutT
MKQIDVAVAVIVDSNNNILLTQRHDPKNPSTHLKWQLPGGGIEKNETASPACYREVLEETGLTVKILSQNPHSIINTFEDKTYRLTGFKVKVISGTIDVEKDEETGDARWYKREEILSLNCLPNTLEMIDGCLK